MTTAGATVRTTSDSDSPHAIPIQPVTVQPRASTVWRSGWEVRYVYGLVLTDLVAALSAGLFALQLANGVDRMFYDVFTILLPLAWVGSSMLHRGYDVRILFVGGDEYQRVLLGWVTLVAAIAIGSYVLNAQIARSYVFVATPAVLLFGLTSRYVYRLWLRRDWAAGRRLRRVVVVGHERSVIAMARQLRSERYHGMDVIAACLPAPGRDPGVDRMDRIASIDLPVYGTFDDVPTAVHRAAADTVVVLASPELDGAALRRLAWRLERLDIDLIVASALLDVATDRTTLRPVDGLPMLHVEHPRLTGGRRIVKEIVDRSGALLLLTMLSPVLLLIAGLVGFDPRGKGPVLFRQTRVGRDRRTFPMFKFRTMHPDAEARLAELRHLNENDGVLFKMRDDPRVTRVGRWLRRYSLDELPQLLNVLRGEMSLVGPRPPLPAEVARYPSDMYRRLAVKPGLTGLWQVSGRSNLSWDDAIRLDLRYVENWSLTLDVVILFRTLGAVLRSAGAY